MKIIVGNTLQAVQNGIFDNMAKNLNQKNIIIVPEKTQKSVKSQVMDYLSVACVFDLKVVSLKKFFTSLTSQNGFLSREEKVCIVKEILLANQRELKAFQNVCDKDGVAREIFATLEFLIKNQISPNEFLKEYKNVGVILGNKLFDLAIIYQEYLKILKEKNDYYMYLEKLQTQKIQDLKDCNIYVCNLYDLSLQEIKLLVYLSKQCNNFCFGIADNANCGNARIYPHFILEQLEKELKLQNVECVVESKTEDLPFDRKLVVENIFGFEKTELLNSQSIKICTADDTELEVKGVARKIRELVVEKKYRFKDIAVVVNDIDSYQKYLLKQFACFEIPISISVSSNISQFAIVNVFLQAYKVIKSDFQKEKVLSFAKNPILAFDQNAVKDFELFVNEYNLSGEQLKNSFDLSLDEKLSTNAELVRSLVYQMLFELKNINYCNKKQVVDSINNFYQQITLNEGYAKYKKQLVVSNADLAKKSEKAFLKMQEILQNIQNYSDESCNVDIMECFANDITLASVDTVVESLDSVSVSKTLSGNLYSKKVLFVLGANDGNIPVEKNSQAIFSYSNLVEMQNVGINFFPSLQQENNMAKFLVAMLFANGKEQIYLCYNHEKGEPSLIVGQLENLLGVTPCKMMSDANEEKFDEKDYAIKIGAKSNAKKELNLFYAERLNNITTGDSKVFDYLYTALDGSYKYEQLEPMKSPEQVEPNTLAWSNMGEQVFANVSSLETYFKCPFKFYCQNVLKLKDNPKGELDVMLVGSFVHKVLEIFFKERQNFDLSEEELLQISRDICQKVLNLKQFEYVKKLNTNNFLQNTLFEKVDYILKNLAKVAVRSNFKTDSTELSFGTNYSELKPYEIENDGKKYCFRGTIDRVDKYGDYVAIIDYKTSNKVEYSLKQIYYGQRVQLLLYLNAYTSYFDCKPFALLYMPLPYKYSSVAQKNNNENPFKYVGFVRDLDAVIENFDCNAQDGNLKDSVFNFGKDNKLSQSDWDILTNYANQVIVQAITEIESGYIKAKSTDCQYCPYGNICRQKNKPDSQRIMQNVSFKKEEKDE